MMVPTVFELVVDVLQFVALGLRSHARLTAENLFLRKQLAMYLEREAKPRRATNATRLTLVALARSIQWREVLTVVQPDTLVRWHRHAFRLFWRWKSRHRGRPRIPPDTQHLIAEMARANRTWGEERIAAELLKLGVSLSPRTVRRYMRRPSPTSRGVRTQTWSTFVRNHARELLACDFFVTVTARFRLVYVFVASMSGRANCCTGTPPNTRPLSGRPSSSAHVSWGRAAIASCSTIATRSTHRRSMAS